MANRFCYLMNKLDQEKNLEKVRVQTGDTLYAGDVVLAETLDTNITDNIEVYAATPVTDYTAEYPCLVINQGYETLSDGRRPSGNPNIGDYSYTAGDDISVVRLEQDLKFQMSQECVDENVTIAVGVYLIPQNSDYQFTTSASIGSSKVALKIEALTEIGTGGNGGYEFVDAMIVRVVTGR